MDLALPLPRHISKNKSIDYYFAFTKKKPEKLISLHKIGCALVNKANFIAFG